MQIMQAGVLFARFRIALRLPLLACFPLHRTNEKTHMRCNPENPRSHMGLWFWIVADMWAGQGIYIPVPPKTLLVVGSDYKALRQNDSGTCSLKGFGLARFCVFFETGSCFQLAVSLAWSPLTVISHRCADARGIRM